MLGHVLGVDSVKGKTTGLAHVLVHLAIPLGEAPLLGDVNLEMKVKKNLINIKTISSRLKVAISDVQL